MKAFAYTVCFICAILLCGSCNKTSLFEQKAKTLDSLSGAINSIVRELDNVDTLVLNKSIVRYSWYKQFIEQNLHDTITKAEADNLQHFYASGKMLESFSANRRLILARAGVMNSQLAKLSEDIRSKTLTSEQLSNYSLYEKTEAGKLIDAGYHQQKVFHSGLQEFKNALQGVELLIRSKNKGELPIIIKDTVSL